MKSPGIYGPFDLQRLAELEPHILIAHESRNSTDPMQLDVQIRVFREIIKTEPVAEETIVKEKEGSSGIFMYIIIGTGSALLIAIVVIVILFFRSKRRHTFRRVSKKLCGCRCRKKKLTPYQS